MGRGPAADGTALLSGRRGNLEWVTRLYFGAAVICWTTLAAVVAYAIRVRWLAFLGFALILAFALTSPIILWDRDALDESISTSMLALTVAAAIWMLAKPTVASLIVLFLVTAWWVLSRDTNAYLILFSAIALLPAAVLVQGYRGHLLVLAGLFVACFLASSWSADHAQRWVFALLNVIGIRVLPDPTLLSYFASHGMPVNPAVRSMAGQYASGKDNAFYHDPQLHSLYVWVVMHGKDVYVQYLFTHPFGSLRAIWDQLGALMVEGLGNYLPNNFHPVSRWLDADLFPQDQMRLGLLCGGALAAASVVWLIRVGDRRLLIPLWMLATTLPMAAVVWYGEGGMEDSRHQLGTMIQMRLGAWLILLFAVDAILVARRSIANTSRSRENEDRRTTPTSAST